MSDRRSSGFSLIELLIALAIGAVLVLGLVEVFAASRVAYQMAEGVGRVQENARFAMDYLQRDVRMAGHMGCVNDEARFLTNPAGFRNAIDPVAHPELDYAMAIQGYEAAGTGPGDTFALPDYDDADYTPTAWAGASTSPPLPGYIANLTPAPIAGSDIVALRYLSAEGIPVTSFAAGATTTITVDKGRWDAVIADNGYAAPSLLGIADCLNATTFQATSNPTSAGSFTVEDSGLNALSLETDNFTQGQAVLHRAESAVFYIGRNATSGQPSLYRARYTAAAGSGALTLVGGAPEELVEGVENVQLIYGVDDQTDPAQPPTGYVATQSVATSAMTWRRVGLVQVAFLARSPERAAAGTALNSPRLLGVTMTPPEDGRLRTVYESTIALRNRLYGN